MDLRYNPEKRFHLTFDPKRISPKRTPQNLTLKCDPEKHSRQNLDPRQTLSKRTSQNLTLNAIPKNVSAKTLPQDRPSQNAPHET